MAHELIGEGHILRVCDLCGGVDDHPRHVLTGSQAGVFQPSDGALERVMGEAPDEYRTRLVRDLLDTTSSDRHYQCCAEAGCPTGTCGVYVEGSGDAVGAEFLAHLQQVGPEREAMINEINGIGPMPDSEQEG